MLLTACAAPKNTGNQADLHTVKLSFNGSKACHAYLIKNDEIAHEFNKEGDYTITPDSYLFIYSCGTKAYATIGKVPYLPGKTTTIIGNPGIKFIQQNGINRAN